jgi:hypothetical protein
MLGEIIISLVAAFPVKSLPRPGTLEAKDL